MKLLSMHRIIAACAIATFVAGCGGTQSQIGAPGAMPFAAKPIAVRHLLTDSSLLPPDAGPKLYVGNPSAVTVYDPASGKLERKIVLSGDLRTLSIHVDNLYVATGQEGYCSECAVTIYAKGSSKRRTITQGGLPVALAVCSSGNLVVANFPSRNYNSNVSIYNPRTGKKVRTITAGVGAPAALACGKSGELYVANRLHSDVTVYGAGKAKPLRKITGLAEPNALALDGSGNLYVSNHHNSTVTVYAKGGTKLLRTISKDKGVDSPRALAFDSSGNLYVANDGGLFHTTVTVYAKDTDRLLRTITNEVKGPVALAFDGAGLLYVADSESSLVTVYAKDSDKLVKAISEDMYRPRAIAFGP